MEIDSSAVERIAALAKLRFSDSDKEKMVQDMSRIVAFVDKLNELDTDGVEPLVHITDEVNVLRADETKSTISQSEALSNAPQKDSDYFKVPKVIRKG